MSSVYIPLLSGLITAAKQYDDFITFTDQVKPIAWSIVNAKLNYSIAYVPHIAEIAVGYRRQS